jgi:hypothetical protein
MTALRQWARANTLAISIAYGQFLDLGTPLAPDTAPTLTAQVCGDDGAVAPTPLPGIAPVTLTWDAVRREWVGLIPYVVAYDALASVRLIVTGGDERLMDAVYTFARADGR